MIIRSKAPLRIGLAGGGSDVAPYCDLYGGYVLNATINLYAHCVIEEREDRTIHVKSYDNDIEYWTGLYDFLNYDNEIGYLFKGVYNRIVKDYGKPNCGFNITTWNDVPSGSGLGTSSTMVVAILKCFVEWMNLPLGDYEIARLAYEIERIDLGFSGGKQDQYAATFGGFNFMEFKQDDVVIVNPLKVKRWIIDELEDSLVLYFTGKSRVSAEIIDEQKKNTTEGNTDAINAMHRIKQSAVDMKTAILTGDINEFGYILGKAWQDKKMMANGITNDNISNAFNIALGAGATSGKVSGAGGGGFIVFAVDPKKKQNVINELSKLDGFVAHFQFTDGGCHGWKIYDDDMVI